MMILLLLQTDSCVLFKTSTFEIELKWYVSAVDDSQDSYILSEIITLERGRDYK